MEKWFQWTYEGRYGAVSVCAVTGIIESTTDDSTYCVFVLGGDSPYYMKYNDAVKLGELVGIEVN